jgi:KpsF/GutQ family protein
MNTKIKKIAQNVIKLEIDALKKLKKLINNNFIKAVNEITNCKSKVILCGVGKSGLIASKISATLSSVGCPSFSISANDCLHGDLGSISKNDLLILISNSGESEELHPIIKYANRNGIKLIGITSKKNSVLSKGSDIILLIPGAKEAGLGIVPTSSTSMQLAIGDALAVATINKKRFNKYDFSKLHPAGNLGKQLKTVEDLMVINEKIPFINENKNIKEINKDDNNSIQNLEYEVNIDEKNYYKIVSVNSEIYYKDSYELLKMEKVEGVFFNKLSSYITITSDNAIYNINNHKTNFLNNVRLVYFDDIINGENLILDFEKKRNSYF